MDIKSTVYDKSEDFAVRIINLYKYLCTTKKEFVLSKQILHSGTGIVANLSEAQCAISKQDSSSTKTMKEQIANAKK